MTSESSKQIQATETDGMPDTDFGFPVTVPCAATVDANIGSTCSVATTANAVMPASILEVKGTLIGVDQIRLFDSGPDGVASTAAGNTLFAVEGLFVP